MWKHLVTDSIDQLVATNFFTVDVVGWLGTRTYDVLFAIDLETRQVKILGVSEHSRAGWLPLPDP